MENQKVGATREQSLVSSAFETLGFKMVIPPDNKVGGPQKFTIDKKALVALEGKTVVVDSDATVTIR